MLLSASCSQSCMKWSVKFHGNMYRVTNHLFFITSISIPGSSCASDSNSVPSFNRPLMTRGSDASFLLRLSQSIRPATSLASKTTSMSAYPSGLVGLSMGGTYE